MEEMQAAEERGAFSYQPPRPEGDDDDDDQFQEAQESQAKPVVRNEFHKLPYTYMICLIVAGLYWCRSYFKSSDPFNSIKVKTNYIRVYYVI